MRKYGVAIIGCGIISRSHIKAYQAFSGQYTIKAVCDLDISTTPFVHREAIIESLKAGKHVLCGKCGCNTINHEIHMLDIFLSIHLQQLVNQYRYQLFVFFKTIFKSSRASFA